MSENYRDGLKIRNQTWPNGTPMTDSEDAAYAQGEQAGRQAAWEDHKADWVAEDKRRSAQLASIAAKYNDAVQVLQASGSDLAKEVYELRDQVRELQAMKAAMEAKLAQWREDYLDGNADSDRDLLREGLGYAAWAGEVPQLAGKHAEWERRVKAVLG